MNKAKLRSLGLSSLPTPSQLFTLYEKGELTRGQWREAMRMHFIDALAEIERDRQQPRMALLDTWRGKRKVVKLLRHADEAQIREVFLALSELDDFPPALYLWNADQPDIPLYAFLREKRTPIFRVLKADINRDSAELQVEYGCRISENQWSETISLRRSWRGHLELLDREKRLKSR